LTSLVLLLALSLPAPALALTPGPAPSQCAPVDEAVVDQLFQRWADAVNSADPELVANLYAPDALLLPTLSPLNRHSHGAIADYFASFLARHPQAVVLEHQVFPGCNQLIDAGLYRFAFHDGQGNPSGAVEARYTLVYGFSDGQWQVLHHHSSLLP
jgi:uncharacterized protein (TIGR02246 family)